MPSPIVISAAVAGMSVFGFVLLFFRVPRRGLTGMQRMYLAWISGALVWVACLLRQLPAGRPFTFDEKLDLGCGALVIWFFIWGSYWFANLGGGFRVLMLMDLAQARRAVTLSEWMDLYGQGRGMREFLDDRLRSILVPVRVVTVEGDQVVLTQGRGRILAFFLRTLAWALLKKSR